MNEENKILTYIGFSVKSGNIVYGLDKANEYKGKAYLAIASNTLSERSLRAAVDFAEKKKCPVLKSVSRSVEELTRRKNCKFIALTDKNLSRAILDNVRTDFVYIGRQ